MREPISGEPAMVHCTKCGAVVPENARFCQKCGQEQPAITTAPAAANPSSQSGLSENVAGLLCYVLGWITGLIFFLIDRRPYVRFHAVQSVVTFGGLHIIRVVLGAAFGVGFVFGGPMHWGAFGLGAALLSLLGLVTFVLWVVCMVKAYQGERFKLPIAGDIAEGQAGR
jgi:uncharacterized membrane protein